jgi:hypothetical protein
MMRRFYTGLLAALLVLGLLGVEPLQAKVYKMKPEERAAALKEKRAKRARAKKVGKAAPGADQGGWVEVKPGERISKKNRKSQVDEVAKAAERKSEKAKKSTKSTKSKKSKKASEEPVAEKQQKKSRKSHKDVSEAVKPEKKSRKSMQEPVKASGEAIVVEKKGHKSKAEKQTEQEPEQKPDQKIDQKIEKRAGEHSERKSGKKSRKSASRGDRKVGRDFSDGHKVSASSAEVHRAVPARPATVTVDDPKNSPLSVSGQEKSVVIPEVRQEVQPGPLDASRPVNSDVKAGEGRF